MNTTRIFPVLVLSLLTATTVCAQRGGGPPGGDRGGGGFRGGGAPGGDRGGGGFRGGGAPGGDRGGGTRGAPGGDRGSGGRGSFDATAMLSRLDTNKNGILDPSEQQGPAQFLISRMQQSDPSIKPGQPISLKKVSEGFDKMRAAREQQQSGGAPAGNPADDALLAEMLVPGFGSEEEPLPLMGFGATAEMLSVAVTEADKRESEERMRRYDRNKDGFLTKDELSSRFSGNPMDFDRNRDGKLSVSELAVRYARRREGEEAAKSARNDRRRTEPEKKQELEDIFGGRKSYRIDGTRKLPEGLPGYFTDKDANEDGQITMAEFSSEWNESVVAEYFHSDLNGDGIITADEAIRAVELGDSPREASGGSYAASSSGGSKTAASSSSAKSDAPMTAPAGKPEKKNLDYAKRIIDRNDKNKDGALTAAEWSSMLMSPAKADFNRDGRITTEEYALWIQARSKK